MMKRNKRVLTLMLLIVTPAAIMFGYATKVVRGPYLQQGAPNTIIIRWRTDRPTASRVSYGVSENRLDLTHDDLTLTTEHILKLTELMPDTRYFYAIGTTTKILAGGGANHYFLTSPRPGAAKPTRIWILGDSGSGSANTRRVRDGYNKFARNRHTDFCIMLGDNAYHGGADEEYQHNVFDGMFEEMLNKSVLWTTLGNHDCKTTSNPGPYPYYDIFTLPTRGEAGGLPSGTEGYYSFDYGNIHMICLNSATDYLRSENSGMWVWLEEDLAANDKLWTIAFWHHPPYSKGSHDSDVEIPQIEMRERAIPILEDAGVDLVISGHSHAYERSFLLEGYYGNSMTLSEENIVDRGNGREGGDGAYKKSSGPQASHQGAVYLVNGSSGKIGSGKLDHPAMATSLRVLGSMVLDIDSNRLHARFIDDSGNVRDSFTILKEDAGHSKTEALTDGDSNKASPAQGD